MRTGRPRKPNALKKAEGTWRKDRAVNEAVVPQEVPSIPAHLSADAKREWKRVAQRLANYHLLTGIDRALLAAYCEAWADWKEATIKCAAAKVIKTSNGNFVENPFFSIKKRSAELMHKFGSEFGIGPASRSRIHLDTNEADTSATRREAMLRALSRPREKREPIATVN